MSLEPVAGALEKAMGRPVRFVATNWRDGHAREAVKAAAPGDLLLMENTRFHPGGVGHDPVFDGHIEVDPDDRGLAAKGDIIESSQG